MKKLTKIRESIQEINKNDEAGCIIVNKKTLDKLKQERLLHFGFDPLNGRMWDIPVICENIKEDCLIISKDTLKKLGKVYGK